MLIFIYIFINFYQYICIHYNFNNINIYYYYYILHVNVVHISEVFLIIFFSPLNSGPNYGNGEECPVLRGFTVYELLKTYFNS